MSFFGKTLANLLINHREHSHQEQTPSIQAVNKNFDVFTQWELGTYHHKDTPLRTRKQIYSKWQLMQADPQIAEALSLHVTAALGGHETTGDMIFISPSESVRGKGFRAKTLRKKVEIEAKRMTPILNRNAFSLARQAIAYGDSYARIYVNDNGVADLVNSDYTAPPLILPFEQGGRTIGYFVMEEEKLDKAIAKLEVHQLLRMKMARIERVPQVSLASFTDERLIGIDNQADMPIMPSMVGGSFLYPVERAWDDAMISLMGLNNQQIADSVKQAFLTVNMDGMPPNQQKKYKDGLVKTLQNYRDQIREAFKGGEALYGTKYHVLPTWGDKQNIQPVGDLSQRTAPLNTETLMINLRRIAGGLGLDLSLIGWADMLAGGLGDGASFHTSAQIMRRSMLIRQALIDSYNQLMSLHWGIRYNEYFYDGDYPWQFDFYSDQSAAATEALNNKQTRMNTVALMAQSLSALREVGLKKDSVRVILEEVGGLDTEQAEKLAQDLEGQHDDSLPIGSDENKADDDFDDNDDDEDDEDY
ncbi:hypothetical protein [Faucicola boevrei]|uniref:hypothetical protein n=1 Tax=Faucicola boevrei TaxID=346665 RepID=UPI0003794BFA|nr:hypothetical protein [Moraxella boevrei]